jgi:hypothetical protein
MSRVDRVAGRALREGERRERKNGRRRASAAQAEAHKARMAALTEAHKTDFKRIDWADIVEQGPVAPAVAPDAVSQAARRRLAAYEPSFMDSMLGREREVRRKLMNDVLEAAKADAELFGKAKAAAEAHNRMLKLAPQVAALDVAAIATVIKLGPGVKALEDVVEGFSLFTGGVDRLVACVDLLEYDALPDEACVPGAGAPSYAPIPDKERNELQLANACSVALRAALEVLQAAPVNAVEVVARLCPPRGVTEAELEPVLYLKVPAVALTKLQLAKLDAAPAVTAMGARMDWSIQRGLDPIDLDDVGLSLPTPRTSAAA